MFQGTEVIGHCRHPWADVPYKEGDPVNLMAQGGFSHRSQATQQQQPGQQVLQQQQHTMQQQHAHGMQEQAQQQQDLVSGATASKLEPPSEAATAAAAAGPVHVYLDHQQGCLVLHPDILLSGTRWPPLWSSHHLVVTAAAAAACLRFFVLLVSCIEISCIELQYVEIRQPTHDLSFTILILRQWAIPAGVVTVVEVFRWEKEGRVSYSEKVKWALVCYCS